MAQQERDDWIWDPAGPYLLPLFEREHNRREYLLTKQAAGTLTPSEAQELEKGSLPFAYVGATYYGHPIKVVRLMNGTDDRTPHLLNDPNQWINLNPPFSVKNWPQGPPGWIPLGPGVHYDPSKPQIAGPLRLTTLPCPWDVELQRMMLEGIPGTTPGR